LTGYNISFSAKSFLSIKFSSLFLDKKTGSGYYFVIEIFFNEGYDEKKSRTILGPCFSPFSDIAKTLSALCPTFTG
jgi:hypothetical protein